MGRGVTVMVVASLTVMSACGSSTKESAQLPNPAGAKENAVATSNVCHDWPAGTKVVPCKKGAMGPGRGLVFYDAGSVQTWGRYLEVAPQNWGPVGLFDCPGCGAAAPVTQQSSDGVKNIDTGAFKGVLVCSVNLDPKTGLPGDAGATGNAIGDGRDNTDVLLKDPNCTDGTETTPGKETAVTLAAGYRGGGLADWYLPSEAELKELCKYGGRNAIGGFSADAYATSTSYQRRVNSKAVTDFSQINFGKARDCPRKDNVTAFPAIMYNEIKVRPIRAFS